MKKTRQTLWELIEVRLVCVHLVAASAIAGYRFRAGLLITGEKAEFRAVLMQDPISGGVANAHIAQIHED